MTKGVFLSKAKKELFECMKYFFVGLLCVIFSPLIIAILLGKSVHDEFFVKGKNEH